MFDASVIYSARESTFKNEVIYLAPKSLNGVVEAYWIIKVYPRTDWFGGFYVFSINLLHCSNFLFLSFKCIEIVSEKPKWEKLIKRSRILSDLRFVDSYLKRPSTKKFNTFAVKIGQNKNKIDNMKIMKEPLRRFQLHLKR